MPAARPASLLAALLLVTGLGLTGCGSGDGASGSSTPTKDASGTTTIDITFKGDTVEPSGKQLTVKAGEKIKLHIVADKAGEIHVHSSPEQELEYAAGTSDQTIQIDQPGVVDMESHTLDKLIAKLEVR